MRGRPYNLQGEGVFERVSAEFFCGNSKVWEKEEPTSVLDPRKSPSPSTTTTTATLSSSSSSVGVASVQQKWEWPHTQQQQEENSALPPEQASCGGGGGGGRNEEWGSSDLLQPMPTGLEAVNAGEKCGLGMEDWESMLSESGASLGQEQSLLGWIMGEVEDPSSGFKQLLQSGGGGLNFHNTSGFGVIDPGLGFEAMGGGGGGGGGGRGGSSAPVGTTAAITTSFSNLIPSSGYGCNNGRMNQIPNPSSQPNCKVPFFGSNNNTNPSNPMSSSSPISLSSSVFYQQQQQQQFEAPDVKPQSFISTQNQPFFMPLSYPQQEQHLGLPPHQSLPHHLQFLPQSIPNRPPLETKLKVGDEVLNQQHQQQVMVDQLFKAAELVETGNLVHARGILARLNHQLSHVGKPLQRAAFLFKEALQLLLLTNNNGGISPHRNATPLDVVLKINAYKTFSDVSPLLQFTNFTCNQALLEALESFNNIHIVDFDIGFGGQWASFMQEIRMRIGGITSLKITAFVSPSSHDPLELNLTRDNLSHFANELGIPFELNLVSLDSINPASWSLAINVLATEAVAVNLPIGGSSSHLSSLPLLLRLVKQLSPKIVVSVDRGCDRSDLPFSHYFLHSLQSCSTLLDSLDAVNVNPDMVNKIEKFYILPSIERTLLACQGSPTKMPPWKSLFTSAGFSAVTFSNFTETQAEYVLKRLPVRGFHIEKHHASLMLCWQRRELASVSAWRC